MKICFSLIKWTFIVYKIIMYLFILEFLNNIKDTIIKIIFYYVCLLINCIILIQKNVEYQFNTIYTNNTIIRLNYLDICK